MHSMNPSVEFLEAMVLEQFNVVDSSYDQHQVDDFLSDFDERIHILSQRLEHVNYKAALERGSLLRAPFALLSSGALVRDVMMRPSFVFTSEDDNMEYAVVAGNQVFSEERFLTDSLLAMYNVKARLEERITP